MGEFFINRNYRDVITNLQKSIVGESLELQLVWLSELLLVYFYLLQDVSTLSKTSKGSILYGYKLLLRSIEKDYRTLTDTAKLLVTFRNKFVHEGRLSADMNLSVLLMYKKELRELAAIVDVELNL